VIDIIRNAQGSRVKQQHSLASSDTRPVSSLNWNAFFRSSSLGNAAGDFLSVAMRHFRLTQAGVFDAKPMLINYCPD